MPFVLDASVALAWVFEDENPPYADWVMGMLALDTGIVPSIWALEVANGLRIAERRGRLSSAKVAPIVEALLSLRVEQRFQSPELALRTVLNLARAQALTAYDAAYLDLAMREGLALATEDEELRAAAERVGVTLLATPSPRAIG